MGTKLLSHYYNKDNGDGTVSPISGGTVTASIIRASDGYEWDTASSTFKASGITRPVLTESGVTSGWYSYTLTTTTFSNGSYICVIFATKAGESPVNTQELFSVSSGSASSSAPSAPAVDMCRCYVYFADLPATAPTTEAYYVFQPDSATRYSFSPTATYSAGTGLWYVDLAQESTARVSCPTYGLAKTFFVPALSTLVITTQRGL